MSSWKYLDFADGIKLPVEVVTDTQGVLGIKGGGKTYTMMKLMESMVAGGHQAVAIDPTGVWWGLTSSADGKSAGLDVIVMGGTHSTVPLEPTAGETIARFLVDSGQSAVLSLSHMRKGDRQRFCADFLEQLFYYKDAHREPLHLFLDEAQTLAPQRPGKDQLRVLGAAEDVVLQGRSRGLGMTMGTQRPAVLNKNLTTQVAALILLRIASPQDQAAVMEWLDIHADNETAAAVLKSLGSLGRGEGGEKLPGDAWYISTSGDGATRIRVKEKQTFDSSRTPKPGERAITPKERTPVDLQKLSAEIRATVERAKAADPKMLTAEVDRLKKELARAQTAKAPAVKTPAVKTETKVVEKFVLKDGQIARVEQLLARGEKLLQARAAFPAGISGALGEVSAGLRKLVHPGTATKPAAPSTGAAVAAPARPAHVASNMGVTRKAAPSVDGISSRGQRMLDAAATLTTLGLEVSRETVSAWIGVHPRGGSVGEELKSLADLGLVWMDRGAIVVTQEGMAAAEPTDPSMAIDQAKSGLSARQKRIFDLVAGVYPASITREEVATQMNIHPRGGSFGEDIARLAGRGLIRSDRGVLQARDFLFAR